MPWWAWVAVVVGAVWAASAVPVWPFAKCRRCGGRGRWQVTDRPDWRRSLFRYTYCSVCRGIGRRIAVRGGAR